MHIHVLGICGTFMGGLAALAREAGHRVTGCDANVYPPMSDQLRALGIEMIEGWDAAQMRLAPDVYVVGNVVTRGNPLMEAVLDAGTPYTSGPQWLAEHVLQGRHVLAVAGTHGKTSTTSMLAWILEHAGLRPGFLVGGVPGNFGVSARLGAGAPSAAGPSQGASAPSGGSAGPTGPSAGAPSAAGPPQGASAPSGGSAGPTGPSVGAPSAAGPPQGASAPSGGSAGPTGPSVGAPFVIEADEYDTAFFDKRSKFVHYRPRTAVLNNLEFDHADIFADLGAIETQFHHLVRTVPASGRLVVNARDEALQRVLERGCWSEVTRFGARRESPGVLRARGEPHDFDVLRGGLKVAHVQWPLLGEHNQLNALAAIAAAEHLGVTPAQSAAALAEFANVKRRMELRGEAGGVQVYDDFAHHPSAIRTTLDGLRRKVGPARILAVFEPRSNTMKLGSMKARLPWALEEADLAFCHAGGLGWDAAEALAPMGEQASTHASIDALVAAVARAARPGDQVVCMSNGGFGGVHDKLLAALARRG